jgi:hypothetical protein
MDELVLSGKPRLKQSKAKQSKARQRKAPQRKQAHKQTSTRKTDLRTLISFQPALCPKSPKMVFKY